MLAQFVKERDEAFTDFVMTGSTKKLKAYFQKYNVPMPKDKNIMAAGVYKAVQHCTGISDEVKNTAVMKCLDLGFSPFSRMGD